VRKLATDISEYSKELLDFVHQLHEMSKFEGITPTFTFIEVNLSELMASYRREALNYTKPDVTVRVTTDLSPHCKATLDTNSMHQLMMHLLNNAAKHTTQGDIVMHYANERRGIKVAITYQGNGQSNVIGEDIFSYLQREEALTMVNGTDVLSIPICKAIVDALGGELDITTENGQKTTVTFWFPCRMRERNKGV
jgi:K+-sensing histidine kinase KdpD